ncbi:MAG: DnaA/Hda family protein [Gemmatimonadota bacterium]
MAELESTFDSYAVGASNELAATAARRVAETPGTIYNPLVLCGPTGVGKTHLLEAIRHATLSADFDLAVHCESATSLSDRIVEADGRGGLADLRQAIEGFDVLLVDDLDGLDGRPRSQRELLECLRTLVETRRQVVVASRMAPGEYRGLSPELRDILEGGLIVDIGAPEPATRRAIVQRLLTRHDLSWSADVVDAMAEYELTAEELHGAVERLRAITEASPPGPTVADVAVMLQGSRRTAPTTDEFGSFLEDVSRIVAAVVETEPWRRRVAESILRWEGEGIRTRRLDRALEADAPRDVDALLESFDRDAIRLLAIRERLGSTADLPDDPDDLAEADRILRERSDGSDVEPSRGTPADSEPPPTADPTFLDPARVVLSAVDLDGRLVEEPG